MNDSDRIALGTKVRAEVLGADYVNRAGPTPTKFQQAFRDFTVENCWGSVWIRPGLDRKTRSMLNLAMLSVMARWTEFSVHVRGALNNGVTEDEIIEIVLQAGVYAGVPIAAEAMRHAEAAVTNYKNEKK